MSDIVERLRLENRAFLLGPELHALELEAADEIERLREKVRNLTLLLDEQVGTPCEQIRHEQEVERLRALLRPFVDMVAEPEDFAAARRALEGK
jgi:hypothetical protein